MMLCDIGDIPKSHLRDIHKRYLVPQRDQSDLISPSELLVARLRSMTENRSGGRITLRNGEFAYCGRYARR